MTMKEKFAQAYEYLNSKELTAKDFDGVTTIHHSDMSVFTFSWSICEEKGEFIYVWSEHNGYHLWHNEDIERVKYEKQFPTPKEDLWDMVREFITDNALLWDDEIDKLFPPEESERYTSNEFIKDCCEKIGLYKENREGKT